MTGLPLSNVGDVLDETAQAQILDAAVETLLARRVGGFTLEGVAERAGVAADTIREVWPNTPELFTATLRFFGERHLPVPDTGSLEGDFLQYARSYTATLNTAVGRRMVDALIVKSEDWDLTESRSAFLTGRVNVISVMVQRGIERGECPAGTDPILALDMLASGLMLPVLFFDRDVSDEHCAYVVRTVLYGITGKR